MISYTSGPAIGSYIYFNYNFSASVAKTGGFGTLLPLQYDIFRPPDGKFADKANHLLPADLASAGFSSNGRWMVVSDPNVAMLRVNLETFEVLPFAPSFSYTLGQDPGLRTAITNDGRYAVVVSSSFSTFKVYDLNTCSAAPDTISRPVACQSRDLQSFMQQKVPSYSFVTSVRFMNDDSLAIYAVYRPSGVNKTARFLISDNGEITGLDYLALGDSYISGEGAFDYVGGTDTSLNKCHLSYLSYPFLIGQNLNYNSYHSVACSGATTNDVVNTRSDYVSQADKKNRATRAQWDASGQSEVALSSFLPGYVDQLGFVSRYQPKAVTISIGGNDVNMIGTLKGCILKPSDCMSTYEDRLEFVYSVNRHFNDIYNAYDKIKKAGPPDMRIYAIGYPQVAKPGGDCGFNVHLNSDEVLFTTQAIDYLNSVVKAATDKAGVLYVDAADALDGHRLCEARPGSVAVNGVTIGNDIPNRLNGPIGSESFHPNAFGHLLLENKILAVTKNLAAPMPAPDPNSTVPPTDGLEILNAPRSGRPVNTTEYDPNMSADLAYRSTPVDINISGAEHSLSSNTSLSAEVHSEPISLGSFKTDPNGNLSAQITIPSNLPAGYHTLHFYGADISGQSIDIYKDIYVAASADDLDGNGIADIQQKCVGVEPSGVDADQDGIDDSCDGDISLPPAGSNQPAVLSSTLISSNPDLVTFAPQQPIPNNLNRVSLSTAANPKVLAASTFPKNDSSAKGSNLRLSLNYILVAVGLIFLVSACISLF